MKERFKSNVAVFLVLTRVSENNTKEILLQRRQNTGCMDNMYDCGASGHLEPNESIIEALIRESKEELNIKVYKENLKLVHISHEVNSEYIRFFFETQDYEGIPEIGEPEKCSELLWSNIKDLPQNTAPHIKQVIFNILNNINYYDDHN